MRAVKNIAKHLNNEAVRAFAAHAVRYEIQERLNPEAREAWKRLAYLLADALEQFDIVDQGMDRLVMDVNDVFRRLPEEARKNLSDGKKAAFEAACYLEVRNLNKNRASLCKMLEEHYDLVHQERP